MHCRGDLVYGWDETMTHDIDQSVHNYAWLKLSEIASLHAMVCVGTDVLNGAWGFAAFFRRALNEFIWRGCNPGQAGNSYYIMLTTHLCIQADSVINGQFTLGTGPSIWLQCLLFAV